MKIRLTTALSGPMKSYSAGDEYPCDADEAQRLIAAGFAVPVTEVTVERAVRAPAPEKRKAKG